MSRIEYWDCQVHIHSKHTAYPRNSIRPIFNTEVKSDKLRGAEVRPGYHGEMGWLFLRPTAEALGSPYTEIFDWSRLVFHWHKDEFDIPPGATRLAFSDACMNQAFCIGTRVIGVQPHIEKTPMSAHKLIQHCRDDVVGNPSIRYPGQLYGTPRRFYEMNEMLSRLLAIWLPEADKDKVS